MDRDTGELRDLVLKNIDDRAARSRGVHPGQVERLLARTWELFLQNIVSCAVVGLVMVVSMSVFNSTLAGAIAQLTAILRNIDDPVINDLIPFFTVAGWMGSSLMGQVLWGWAALGLARGSLAIVRLGHADIGDFFVLEPMLVLKGVVAQLVYWVIVSAGTCAFVVPGIVAYTGLMMWSFAMVDEGRGPIGALQRAWQLTDGVKMALFLAVFVTGLAAAILSIFTCGLGLIVMLPLAHILFGLAYEELHQSNLEVLR